jgi:PAS domain S-box-containing protein
MSRGAPEIVSAAEGPAVGNARHGHGALDNGGHPDHDTSIAVWQRWLRSLASVRVAVLLLVIGLSIGGFFYTTHTVSTERRSAAEQRAVTDAEAIQGLLERAGTFETGLSHALASEPAPNGARFQAIVGSAIAPAGIADAMWVESVAASERHAYELRVGPITWGPFSAGPAATYWPATFVTGLPFSPGTDMATVPALAQTLRSPTSVFAGTATAEATVAGQPGFFLVQGAQFGHGPGSQGLLVVFVPGGWLSQSLTGLSEGVAISLDGHRLAGAVGAKPAARQSFQALTQQWQVGTTEAPASPLQAALPQVALAWPLAMALIAFLIARGILRRRRAEHEVDDIFDLSADLLCTVGGDGNLKRVNPAFERALGYEPRHLLTRPLLSFVHPEDRGATTTSLARLREGQDPGPFEARFVRADGTVRWLQWAARAPVPGGLIYAAAHDVTETRVLLQEQAALRRVATLVARGADAGDVFTAVAVEVRQLFEADATALLRYDPDGTAVVVALQGGADADFGSPARSEAPGAQGGDERGPGPKTEVAAPIVVSADLWGTIVATWRQAQPARPDMEARLGQFTELVATAIANAESRALLSASRQRIVATADETRRRIERDLHDGAQQRLVSTALKLKLAEQALDDGSQDAPQFVREALETTQNAMEELRELARGIHPVILTRSGLGPALKDLARRSPIPVVLDAPTGPRLPERTEATLYFVVSEALTNAAKHSGASQVQVTVDAGDTHVRLSVDDDGAGGANPADGSGLVGLRDRVEAIGGTLTIYSPPGQGTHLSADLPISTH